MGQLHSGCSLSSALRISRKLGVRVSRPRRTGELLFVHPDGGRVRHSANRKDASRALTVFLRRVCRARAAETEDLVLLMAG